jgi:hypothetical protein
MAPPAFMYGRLAAVTGTGSNGNGAFYALWKGVRRHAKAGAGCFSLLLNCAVV